MASGTFKQPKKPIVSAKKVKSRSLDTETKAPKKGANAVSTKVKKGWMGSDDGAMKC